MATITPVRGEQQTVVIDLIHVPANIRELDPQHVLALASGRC